MCMFFEEHDFENLEESILGALAGSFGYLN